MENGSFQGIEPVKASEMFENRTAKVNTIRKRSRSVPQRHKKRFYDSFGDPLDEEELEERMNCSNKSSGECIKKNVRDKIALSNPSITHNDIIPSEQYDHECRFMGIICFIWLIMLLTK